jgi:hypothetical protein
MELLKCAQYFSNKGFDVSGKTDAELLEMESVKILSEAAKEYAEKL